MPGPAAIVVLAPGDNVAVALRDVAAGETAEDVRGTRVAAIEAIPQGHKVALAPLAPGDPVVRLRVPVGVATAAIARGALVHVHNVASRYLTNDEDHYE